MKLLLSSLIVLLTLGCSDSNSKDTINSEIMSSPAAVGEAAVPQEDMKSVTDKTITITDNQKIIKTGNYTFETQSVNETYRNINRWVTQQKGFIQSDQTYRDYNRLNRNLIIRIPSEGFQSLVDSLKSGVKAFDTENIELQDVTEEFVDIEARMKAKKELESRYLQLLNKANSMKDMLEIEAQLSHIREEIEAQEGRLKYLQNRVSYSTLNINFYEVTESVKAPSMSFMSRLGKAFSKGFKGIGEFIIGLTTLWPILLLIALIIFWFFRRKKVKS